MLIRDGVYRVDTDSPAFHRLAVPTLAELQALAQRGSERIGRHMERQGMLLRDAEGSHLAFEPEGEQGALARSAGVDQLLRADPYENLLLNSQAMHL
jgi:hypothetical protein